MAIYHPPTFINAYLADKVKGHLSYTLPFFPTTPTAIQDVTETFPDAESNVFGIYDRMLRMRRSPFPHIKSEQVLYYLYKKAGDPVSLIETVQMVQDLLDREDESAEEINNWIKIYQTNNPGNPVLEDGTYPSSTGEDADKKLFKTAKFQGVEFMLPYFHRFKVYQLQETRDIIDFGTARTYAGNKIIIDYDWHKS